MSLETQHTCIFCCKSYTADATSTSPDPEKEKKIKRSVTALARFAGEDLKLSEIQAFPISRCVDCENLTDSFRAGYERFRVLELELEWKLERILTGMKSGTSGRVKLGHLVKKCTRRLHNSQPRVSLPRTLTQIKQEDFKAARCREKMEYFLGWVMSLFAVVMVTGITTGSSLEEQLDCSEGPEFFGEEGPCMEAETSPSETALEPVEIKAEVKLKPVPSSSSSQSSLNYCDICSKSFRYKVSLQTHLQNQHPGGARKRTYRCGVCSISYKSFDGLRRHKLYSKSHKLLKTIILKRPTSVGNEVVHQLESELGGAAPKSVTNDPEPPRYHLRQKRKLSDKLMMAQENNGYSPKNKMESEDDPGSSSSSYSSDTDLSTREEKTLVSRKKTKRHNLICRKDGCRLIFHSNRPKYEQHLKLHEPGHYRCKFCSIVETNVIKLSVHEMQQHSSSNQGTSLEKLFVCPRCPYETQYYFAYKRHFALDHIGGFTLDRKKAGDAPPVKCDICRHEILRHRVNFHFKSSHDITGMDAKRVKRCAVPGCSAYFKSHTQLFMHKRKMHGDPSNPPSTTPPPLEEDEGEMEVDILNGLFKCKFCSKAFSTLHHLQTHKRKHHEQSDNTQPTVHWGLLVCPVVHCPLKFKDSKSLQAHAKLHGTFPCKFCPVVKNYAPDLALHETDHAIARGDQKKKYNCARCPTSLNCKAWYIRHHLKVHLHVAGTVHTCPICGAAGTHKRFVTLHQKSHHNTDGMDPALVQKCDQCAAYFVTGDQLLLHKIRIHYEGKCPQCGKRYPFNHQLKTHMRLAHPLFNPFPHLIFCCDGTHCFRKFATEKELERHKQQDPHGLRDDARVPKSSRDEKRVHICAECGKGFKTKVTLSYHLEYHQGPEGWKFQCATCGKKVATKQKLEQHQRTHTQEKPFICQYCGEKYGHRHNWRNHVKSKHPQEFKEGVGSQGAGGRKGNYVSRKGFKKGTCITAGVQQK